MQYKVTVRFITGNEANFHEIFKIFVFINQKPCGIMGLKICMGDKTHWYYKRTKFH